MTMMSDRTFSPIDRPDIDQRPGTSDIKWAERAYHYEPSAEAATHLSLRRVAGRVHNRLRALIVALVVVLLMVGLGLGIGLGSSSAPTVRRPAPTQTVTAAKSPGTGLHMTLGSPLLRPFPSLLPTLVTPKR